jgi:hypothetical protein
MAHPPSKTPKQAVLYLRMKDTQYECRDCNMFIPSKERCTIHGPNDVIKAHGSCGFFIKGKPMGGHAMKEITLQQSGYTEHKGGFSCKRCSNFDAKYEDCAVVDRFSAGDDYGYIDKDACCNHWEAKR